MSKPKMYHFMGSKQDQKEQQVTVSYDPSVIRKQQRPAKQNMDDGHSGKIGSDLSNMSLAMSMGKDERIFRMLVEYDKGNLMTIESVAQFLNVSYPTAKKYVTESKIKIFDNKLKKYTSGRLPKAFDK